MLMGSGHVMRCLTLAKGMKSIGWQVSFVCRDFPGNLVELIRNEGLSVYMLPSPEGDAKIEQTMNPATWLGTDWQLDAQQTIDVITQLPHSVDWLIVDHYAIDEKWETKVSTVVNRILVIDDLANRKHHCNILLDQNLIADMKERYVGKINKDAKLLLGPDYALLRSEFRLLREKIPQKKFDPKRILLFFGGSDPSNQTMKALEALMTIKDPPLLVDVVVGKGNPNIQTLQLLCAQHECFRLHVQTSKMAELLLNTGFVIGAGGTHTWERCCLGVPSIIIAVADNQIPTSTEVHNRGIALYLGEASDVSPHQIAEAVKIFLSNPEIMMNMVTKCLATVDGCGVERVIEAIVNYGLKSA
ncbi:UDP-2,4-diacetamido-2,4,6-trideoxy-beta-L-altropyranose hydrolase [Brevibacillus sp. SYP-B805]|nr:UDP-2,4-diacetamido-2,4,6-trideoxy-beta-L-altropyranose hydrolase [Brevibacillus sp. SYP-B805]